MPRAASGASHTSAGVLRMMAVSLRHADAAWKEDLEAVRDLAIAVRRF